MSMKEVCSVKEIATYLGVSESKVRQLVRRNGIPYLKLDGQYRFYLPEIQKWLSRITVSPVRGQDSTPHAQEIAREIWNKTAGG